MSELFGLVSEMFSLTSPVVLIFGFGYILAKQNQIIEHQKSQIDKLTDRLMSRSLPEFVSAQALQKKQTNSPVKDSKPENKKIIDPVMGATF